MGYRYSFESSSIDVSATWSIIGMIIHSGVSFPVTWQKLRASRRYWKPSSRRYSLSWRGSWSKKRQRRCTSGRRRLWKVCRKDFFDAPPSRLTLLSIRTTRPQIWSGVELHGVNNGRTMARVSNQWPSRSASICLRYAKACRKCRAPSNCCHCGACIHWSVRLERNSLVRSCQSKKEQAPFIRSVSQAESGRREAILYVAPVRMRGAVQWIGRPIVAVPWAED